MIKVYTANGPAEAQLVKGYLESEGVKTLVQGEGLFALRGGIGTTADSLPTVWVPEGQVEQALDLIARFQEQGGGN
jgi:hypothetical protein